MAVRVDSGPVNATDRLETVPREKWHDLMCTRAAFLAVKLSYDCRCLVEFVADAEAMYSELGYESAEAMIREGYRLEPEEINIAVEWLKLNPPDEPLPLDQAVKLGRRGRPKWIEQVGSEKPCNTRLKYGTADYWLARLDRDGLEELAAKVRSKKLSANAAAEKAGYRKRPTPLQIILKQLPKLTEEECSYLRELLDRQHSEAA
jgi:hypothetical protein